MFDDILMHYGTPRHSGRYPWGSGENPYQRYGDFYSSYHRLKSDGLSEKEIARQLGVVDRFGEPSISKLRAKYSNAKAEKRAFDRDTALKYKEDGLSNTEIGKKMGINESSVRSLLDDAKAARNDLNRKTADILKDYVDKNRYVDIGPGTEIALKVSDNRLKNAVALLEEDGYKKQFLRIDQMGTDHKTTVTVLTPPDVEYSELAEHRFDVKSLIADKKVFDVDGEVKSLGSFERPDAVSSDRVAIKYAEEGGIDRDGLIEIRRGLADISIGDKQYAQVRINVDDSHYIKGMCVYSDDLPAGTDILFNTNKHIGTDKMDVLKPLERKSDGSVDWDNPFKSSIATQREYIGEDGKKHISPVNIVREEGEWQTWSKNLASQFASKQPINIADRQLKLAYNDKKQEFDDICALTNPTVKRKLLLTFADQCDSAAVDLKAAPFAKQQTHVILPFPGIKDGEVYAPNYPEGTRVALVRYPHGGTFEIPELTVHNKGSVAEKTIFNAPDAIGINSKVAARLSGADFDGDTVVVIPLSDKVKVRSTPALSDLQGFDPKEAYPGYPGMKVISNQAKQTEMGKVSNLITDMTIKRASDAEIARAVKHSMVVIDAEKHKLNWKQSEIDNGIAELKRKYQDNGDGKTGASTIISRASSETDVKSRKDWYASTKSIDPETGEKKYTKTGETYKQGKLKGVTKEQGGYVSVNEEKGTGRLFYLQTDPSTGKKVRIYAEPEDFSWIKEKERTQKSTKMAEATDAFTLTSGGSKENPGYPIEKIYANYANNMKALGNAARKEWLRTAPPKRDEKAALQYKAEVESLGNKLKASEANAPRERQAQLLANRIMAVKKADNPGMTKEDEKKYKGRAIKVARDRVGAQKYQIKISDDEWKAIQAGAISHSRLSKIIDNADLDRVRALATPRRTSTITPSMKSLAKSMKSSGYTTAQIADRLGISVSSVYGIASSF